MDLELVKKYPEKPVLVTFSGEKQYIEEYKESLEPRGILNFPEIEQPFEVLSILSRCTKAMNRSPFYVILAKAGIQTPTKKPGLLLPQE